MPRWFTSQQWRCVSQKNCGYTSQTRAEIIIQPSAGTDHNKKGRSCTTCDCPSGNIPKESGALIHDASLKFKLDSAAWLFSRWRARLGQRVRRLPQQRQQRSQAVRPTHQPERVPEKHRPRLWIVWWCGPVQTLTDTREEARDQTSKPTADQWADCLRDHWVTWAQLQPYSE